MDNHSFLLRKVLSYFSAFLVCSVIGVTVAHAATLYWVGNYRNNTNWEDPLNWSATLGGDGGVVVPNEDDDAILYLSHTGSTVWMRSNVNVRGIVMNRLYTGSLLLGTGAITVGRDGIRMGSGYLVGRNNNLSMSGSSFTMTGGIVKLPNTKLILSGSLAISKGAGASYTSFTSTGAIVFDGAADQNFTVGSTATTYFRNLTLENTGGTNADDIIVSGSPLKLSGALLITQGNLDLHSNDVVLLVESGITIASNAQATLETDANVTASGHIVVGASGLFTMSGTSTLTLNGNNQNLDTNNNPLYNLTIASVSGKTTTLTSDQSVTNTLQVNTGATLSLGTYTVYATGTTIINYGTITEGTGKIEHTASSILITDSTYAEDDSLATTDVIYFTVTDSDENIDGTAQDTISVTVTGTSGDSETVTLTETTDTSGIFRGSIPAGKQVIATSNGVLETLADTTITLTYADAQDGESTADTASLTIPTGASTTTTTTGGGGTRGGGGGGGGGTTTSGTDATAGAAAGAELPQKGGKLEVSIGGRAVVFKDVPVAQWFAPFVLSLVDKQVISGYRDARGNLTGEFKPSSNVTYAELAKMAVMAAGLQPRTDKAPKNRFAKGEWSAGYVAALEERGISVFADPALNVNKPAPRGAVVQIILEAFGKTVPTAQGGVYSDVSAGTAHAAAVEQATKDGLVSGDDGKTTFRPNASVNRAETAKIVKNAISTYEQ